jgi:small-conductance mechanosensitive channel
LAGILDSLKKLAAFLILIIALAVITIFLFDFFVAGATNSSTFLVRLADITIIFSFAAVATYSLTRAKKLLTPHVGAQAASVLQFLLLMLALGVTGFGILGVFNVNPTTLIAGAGIISITVGLIISTFVGSILSGTLVITAYKFKIGEDVMVNNVPGKIADMTALVTRIRTDVGQITVPNSAIASGSVVITAVLKPEPTQETRLHYVVGDRVITSYMNEAGIVKELNGFHTVVLLDSGKEITYLNSSVLSGVVAVAKLVSKAPSTKLAAN